jgi:hypothetical protein
MTISLFDEELRAAARAALAAYVTEPPKMDFAIYAALAHFASREDVPPVSGSDEFDLAISLHPYTSRGMKNAEKAAASVLKALDKTRKQRKPHGGSEGK